MTMQPPLAPGLPIIQQAPGLLRNPLDLMLRMYYELGPVYRVRGGGREYTVLAGLEANRWFSQHADEYMSSGPVYQPYMDDMGSDLALVALDGDQHKTFRKSLRPGYSREAIAPHLPDMLAEIEKATQAWEPGQKINVLDTMQLLVSQVMGIGMARCPVDHHFSDVRTFGLIFLGAGVGGFPNFMRRLPHYRAARQRALRFIQARLDDHRQHPNKIHPDLLDVLLQTHRPDGSPLSETDLLATAHTAYTNGLVYVSASSGFMLYRLLKHPEVLEKVQPEIDDLFANGTPDINHLRQSRWLRGAFMESIRLHPVALSNPRYVEKTFEFAGYEIKAGSATLTATAVCHYLPELFPDPTSFDIERFSPPRSEHRQPGAFVPFGLDAHSCLAAGVVEAVMMLIVGKLLHKYRFKLDPPSYNLKLSVMPFPAPESGFNIHLSEIRVPALVEITSYEDIFAALLPDVDAREIDQLAQQAVVKQYEGGQTIIREGDPAEAFFIILDGEVEISQEQAGILAHLHSGQYFGEIGLLYGTTRNATVHTTAPTTVLSIDRQSFIQMVTQYDLTSGEIAKLVHKRRITTTVARVLPTLSVNQIDEWLPEFEVRTYDPGATVIKQ
nr:cytochrome P450 [Anaerolineae bacterium]